MCLVYQCVLYIGRVWAAYSVNKKLKQNEQLIHKNILNTKQTSKNQNKLNQKTPMQNKQFQVQNKQSFTELTLDDLPRDTRKKK